MQNWLSNAASLRNSQLSQGCKTLNLNLQASSKVLESRASDSLSPFVRGLSPPR